MTYPIEISHRAARDIEEAFDYIRSRAPLNALRWRAGLERRLRVLETSPQAFGFAPENDDAKGDVRQMLYGRYRILYTIRAETVFVLTVRHGARLFLTGEEIGAEKRGHH
jgi:plasmid stabilization system protein ParE